MASIDFTDDERMIMDAYQRLRAAVVRLGPVPATLTTLIVPTKPASNSHVRLYVHFERDRTSLSEASFQVVIVWDVIYRSFSPDLAWPNLCGERYVRQDSLLAILVEPSWLELLQQWRLSKDVLLAMDDQALVLGDLAEQRGAPALAEYFRDETRRNILFVGMVQESRRIADQRN